MANQQAPIERIDTSPESHIEKKASDSPASSPFDSLKLMSEAGKILKDSGSKALEAFGMPTFSGKTDGKADGKTDVQAKSETTTKAVETIAAKAGDSSKSAATKDAIADKVIERIKDSKDPVQDIKSALKKLDNLQDATVTRNGSSSHIEVNLKHGETSAPPNIEVRGFRPVASHTGSHLAFDLAHTNGGVMLSNMEGFSSSVQGPLGRIRHSETTGLFIGKDSSGRPYVNSSSDLYMRRRVHSSSTTLREENFPADSPMRSAMQHPEALDNVGKMLGMFQNTDDLTKLGIKRQQDGFDLKSESKAAKHVELNYDYKPEGLPITIKVGSLDLDKTLSASLSQEKDSVTLAKISGLKANVEIAGSKASLCPSKVSVEKDMLKMELKNPQDGAIIPLNIPIAKLREAAARKH